MLLFTVVALVAFSANQINAQVSFDFTKDCTRSDEYSPDAKGFTRVSDPENCRRFYNCFRNNQSITSEPCQEGTIFDKDENNCNTKAKCQRWRTETCNQGRGVQERNFQALCCNRYFNYSTNCDTDDAGQWKSVQCRPGLIYNPNTRNCDPMFNANAPEQYGCNECEPSSSAEVCAVRRQFQVYVTECSFKPIGAPDTIMFCAPGTWLGLDRAQHCGCVNDPADNCLKGNPSCSAVDRQTFAFSPNNLLQWMGTGYIRGVPTVNLDFARSIITFSSASNLFIQYFSGNDFLHMGTFLIRIRFTLDWNSLSNTNISIFSNAYDGCSGPRVSLTLNAGSRSIIFEFQGGTPGTTATILYIVPFTAQASQQIDAEFLITTDPVTSERIVDADVRASGSLLSSRTTLPIIVFIPSARSNCPLRVGNGFVGNVEELSVYRCAGSADSISRISV